VAHEEELCGGVSLAQILKELDFFAMQSSRLSFSAMFSFNGASKTGRFDQDSEKCAQNPKRTCGIDGFPVKNKMQNGELVGLLPANLCPLRRLRAILSINILYKKGQKTAILYGEHHRTIPK
jgi:hypothetical protein